MRCGHCQTTCRSRDAEKFNAESADAEDAAAADLEEAAEAEDMEAITESAKVVSGG